MQVIALYIFYVIPVLCHFLTLILRLAQFLLINGTIYRIHFLNVLDFISCFWSLTLSSSFEPNWILVLFAKALFTLLYLNPDFTISLSLWISCPVRAYLHVNFLPYCISCYYQGESIFNKLLWNWRMKDFMRTEIRSLAWTFRFTVWESMGFILQFFSQMFVLENYAEFFFLEGQKRREWSRHLGW